MSELLYTIQMVVRVRVYGDSYEDAAELAADSTANWNDWNVIESAPPMESNPSWPQIVSFLAGDK